MGNKKIDEKYFEDIIEEEDIELLQELEADEDSFSLDGSISMVIEELIFEYDFVKETYYRLKEKHSDEEVMELLKNAYYQTLVIEEETVFDIKKFEKIISNFE